MDGADILEVLDEQGKGLRQLIKNTGVIFKALNERTNGLRDLIVNSNNVFEATASRDEALAETFSIFPTFLDESKAHARAAPGLRQRHAPARPRPAAGRRTTSARRCATSATCARPEEAVHATSIR